MINQRLLAAFEQLQVERAVRSEADARRIGSIVDASMRRLVREIVVATPDRAAAAIEAAVRETQATTLTETRKRLVAQAKWSHRQTARIYARVIPRKWFRKINPAVILIGEDDRGDDPGSGGAAPDAATLPQIQIGPGVATIATEPIAGQRLTDAEWQAWVDQHVFPPLSEDVIDEIVRRPVAGIGWEQRIQSLSRLVDPVKVASKITQSLAGGLMPRQLYKELLPLVTGGIKASAMRIARTESMRVGNEAQRASYSDLGDLMIGTQIHAFLDQRTRPHHGLRHGTIYYKDERLPSIAELPVLPDEPNCRCGDAPVLSEPEELKNDPQLRAEFQRLGAAAIPDPESYERWFRQSGEAERVLAVGKRRYNAIKSKWAGIREPTYFDFVDGETGRLMPVNALLAETDQQRIERQRKLGEIVSSRSELIAQVLAKGFI